MVLVIKLGTGVIGYFQNEFLCLVKRFIQSGGSITYVVTGSHHCTVDLPQGEL